MRNAASQKIGQLRQFVSIALLAEGSGLFMWSPSRTNAIGSKSIHDAGGLSCAGEVEGTVPRFRCWKPDRFVAEEVITPGLL